MAQVAWDAMELAKELNIPISVDVADPFVVSAGRDEMWRALREYADIAFLNEEEAQALTGLSGHEAVEAVGEVVDVAVVKLGKSGSLIRTKGRTWKVGIHATKAVDTTGAGDTYAAGYLHGWLQGWNPEKSGDLGARLASLTVSQIGAVCRDGAEVSRILSAMEAS
jgi:sugar/nucleoside kinase (ribokinase family)